MKDFDIWNEVKKETEKIQKSPMIKKGEICWCRFGINIGNETIGKGKEFSRPVLILKKFSSDTFWGIPLTSKRKDGSWYYFLEKQNRTLILNQIRTFDRKRLQSKITQLPSKQLEIVLEKIIDLLKS